MGRRFRRRGSKRSGRLPTMCVATAVSNAVHHNSLASPIVARGTPRQQYIHKEFNAESHLQITIEPGSREITKDIDID